MCPPIFAITEYWQSLSILPLRRAKGKLRRLVVEACRAAVISVIARKTYHTTKTDNHAGPCNHEVHKQHL